MSNFEDKTKRSILTDNKIKGEFNPNNRTEQKQNSFKEKVSKKLVEECTTTGSLAGIFDREKFKFCSGVIKSSRIEYDAEKIALEKVIGANFRYENLGINYRETIDLSDLFKKFQVLLTDRNFMKIIEDIKIDPKCVQNYQQEIETKISKFIDEQFPKIKNIPSKIELQNTLVDIFTSPHGYNFLKFKIYPLRELPNNKLNEEIEKLLSKDETPYLVHTKNILNNIFNNQHEFNLDFSIEISRNDIAQYCNNNLPSNFLTLSEQEKNECLENFLFDFVCDFSIDQRLNENLKQTVQNELLRISNSENCKIEAINEQDRIINNFVHSVVRIFNLKNNINDPICRNYIDNLFGNISKINKLAKEYNIPVSGLSDYIQHCIIKMNKCHGLVNLAPKINRILKGPLNESINTIAIMKRYQNQLEYISIGKKFKYLIINPNSNNSYKFLDGEIDLEYKSKNDAKPTFVEVKSNVLYGVFPSLGIIRNKHNGKFEIKDNIDGKTPQGRKLIDIILGDGKGQLYYVFPYIKIHPENYEKVITVIKDTIKPQKEIEVHNFLRGIEGLFLSDTEGLKEEY